MRHALSSEWFRFLRSKDIRLLLACALLFPLISTQLDGKSLLGAQTPAYGPIGFFAGSSGEPDAAIHTSMMLTIAWVPIVICCVLSAAYEDYRSYSISLSIARGETFGGYVLGKVVVRVFSYGAVFFASCMVSFIFASIRYGSAFDLALFARGAGTIALTALLLGAVAIQAMALFYVSLSATFSALVMLCAFLYPLLAYVNNYLSYGSDAIERWIFLTPAPYFAHACAGNYGAVSVGEILIYIVAVIFLSFAALSIAGDVRKVMR